MATDTLTRRDLNRATLARQHLLDRVSVGALDTIEHLGGMQAQAPLAPYAGLWTRLRDFDARELAGLTQTRRVVRLHLMRNTMHLVSARDCLDWRALFDRLHAAELRAHFPSGSDGLDREALLRHAGQLRDGRPRTRAELGRLLSEHWPDADPLVLAYAATHHLALCQVAPRGVWGARGGPAAWAPVETWLGEPLRAGRLDELVRRYLGGFGPATVADLQVWSGLTRLREVVEELALRTFRGDGPVLYNVPDAPRPPPDTPAPPRFLPAYDNLLLSYADRSRVIVDHRRVPLPPGNGATVGTFLVDGTWRGTWQVRGTSLHLAPFTPLRRADRDALLAEAGRLGAFLARPERCTPVLGSE